MPFAACIPIAIALAMIAGVMLGWPTLRLRGDYLAIVTLGFGEIIRIVAANSELDRRPAGIIGIPGRPGPESTRDDRSSRARRSHRWYWLALRRAGHPDLPGPPAGAQPGRPGLAGDPRGRGRRRDHGRAAFKFKLWAFAIGAALGGLAGAAVRQQAGVHRTQRRSS